MMEKYFDNINFFKKDSTFLYAFDVFSSGSLSTVDEYPIYITVLLSWPSAENSWRMLWIIVNSGIACLVPNG